MGNTAELVGPVMDIDECARYTKFTRSTIYKKKHFKQIPYVKIGGKLLFPIRLIDEWIAANTHTPNEQPSQSRFQSARDRLRSLKTELTENSSPKPVRGMEG